MSKFYNPYNFVPVSVPSGKGAISRDDFREGMRRDSAVTHERYVEGRHSGRLLVRLSTVTPVVVGNAQNRPNDKEYATIAPYKSGDIPAIPASALRGMIGSVVESATNAPLRVLHDRSYSFRRKMETSLSAIGLIVKDNDGLKLRPMCLPTLESKDGGQTYDVPVRFYGLFPVPQFKVYFSDATSIRDPKFMYRTHLADTPPVEMPVKQLAWSGRRIQSDPTLHVKANRYLVAQDPDTRYPGRFGRVRVLGCWPKERRDEIPGTKKHELWIPEPHPKVPSLPLSIEAQERFSALATERSEDKHYLPFEPLETRPPRKKGESLVPWPGDMVFFDVNEAGTQVIEFSYSAIWRSRVEDKRTRKAATARTFFGAISPELLPAGPDRKTVSPAELLLGFVDDDTRDENTSGLALASRVRFSDALPNAGDLDSLLLEQAPLKILGSPKQPCPAMYFKPKQGTGYIEKSHLNPAEHQPNGRKWYLHAKPQPGSAPWKTNAPNDAKTMGQKNLVTPIAARKHFYFHIDVDNLTDVELGYCCSRWNRIRHFATRSGWESRWV